MIKKEDADKAKNNYIYALEQTRESLEIIQQQGKFDKTEILLMLILGLELNRAEYELSKEQEDTKNDKRT